MYWCFRSFGLRPQDDKRSPQDNKGYVILSKAKNLNRKIPSLFINRINQCILTFTFPSFQLFLPGDCLVNI